MIETFILSVVSCMICIICCMCRREDSTDMHEYTLIPSTDVDRDTSSNSTITTTTNIHSPVQTSSVEPIIQTQTGSHSHSRIHHEPHIPHTRIHGVRRVHRTPRKPIPRHFAKTIENLEYMV